jgi:hypothetical protein
MKEIMKELADIISRVETAFSIESGTDRAVDLDPGHCEECAAADEALLCLDPCDINTRDLTDEARNWIFSFATKESLRWLTPGIVRVALAASPPCPALLFDLISQRTTELFSDDQWLVVLDLAEVCCSNGWITREALGMLGPAGKGSPNES